VAQVSFVINGRPYDVACGDGEEEHLRELAEYVDQTVQKLVASVGQVGDARLLVMASLMIKSSTSWNPVPGRGAMAPRRAPPMRWKTTPNGWKRLPRGSKPPR
jgi:hypothetical protein